MQHIRIYLVTIFMVTGLLSKAQHEDTLIIRSYKDSSLSYQRLLKQRDTIRRSTIELKAKMGQLSNLKRMDTTRYKSAMGFQRRLFDSSRRAVAFKKYRLTKQFDSLKLDLKMKDTLQRKMFLKQALAVHRYDSLKSRFFVQRLMVDSQRMKIYQLQRKARSENAIDSSMRIKQLPVKKITTAIACPSGAVVYIHNKYRQLILRRVVSPTLHLLATIRYDQPTDRNDAEWFQQMGISLSHADSGIVITTEPTGLAGDSKQPITIEIPANCPVHILSNYAEVRIDNDISELYATILNGSFSMQDGEKVILDSRYSTVSTKDIENAHIDLFECHFSGGHIHKLQIMSKHSTVAIETLGNADMTSVSDQYTIDNAVSIKGKKDFGKLNLDKLSSEIVLKGANMDATVNSMGKEVSLVQLNSQFGDLKLPVYKLNNYLVEYKGNDVNVNRVFTAVGSNTRQPAPKVKKPGNSLFTVSGGDTTNKHTRVAIDCDFCNVTLK